MAGIRNRFWHWGLAALTAAVLGAELWLAWNGWHAFSSAENLVAQQRRDDHALEGRDPARTASRRQTSEVEITRAAARLAGLEASFAVPNRSGERAPAQGLPAGPGTDAFFELAGFARSMRQQAKLAGVEVGPGETFGFPIRAAEGIGAAGLARVRRQRGAAVRILTALWGTHPRRFVALRRAGAQPSATVSTGRGSRRSEADVFNPDPRLAAATLEHMETDMFQLTFAGNTAALRRFLNALAEEKWPLLVRCVRAEPEAAARRAMPVKSGDPLALVVRPKICRFTVTLESCVLPGTAAAGDTAGPATAVAKRPTPSAPAWPASIAVGGRRYELFTPPSIYFDRNSGRLSWVGDADSKSANGAAPDLELLAVRPGPFRWQLAGYASGHDGVYGVFLDTVRGGTALCGRGAELGDGYTVVELTVHRAETSGAPDGSREWAEAIVVDDSTGARIAVTSRRPCLAGPPQGLFVHRGKPGFRREMREGESVALDGVDYCVERLELAPARAVVARAIAGAARPDVVTLVPRPDRRAQDAPRPATPGN